VHYQLKGSFDGTGKNGYLSVAAYFESQWKCGTMSVCLSVTFIHCCNSLMYLSFSSPNKVGPIVLCLSQQIRDVNESRKTRESVFYRSKEMNLLNSEN